MTSAAERRLATVEGALRPLEAVLTWLAEVQGFSDIGDYARQVVELPVEAAPLSVIGQRVDVAVRADMKGQPREAIEDAVYHATRDAVFLFVLAFQINDDASDMARVEGLRAAVVFHWMGSLLGGPSESDLEPDEWVEHQRELEECWASWFMVVNRLEADVLAADAARARLAERYYAGQELLFANAAANWADHVEMVGHLRRIADSVAAVRTNAAAEARVRGGSHPTSEERIVDTLSWLTDQAKVRAHEMLGDRPRAVAIMERWLYEHAHEAGSER